MIPIESTLEGFKTFRLGIMGFSSTSKTAGCPLCAGVRIIQVRLMIILNKKFVGNLALLEITNLYHAP